MIMNAVQIENVRSGKMALYRKIYLGLTLVKNT